MKRILPRSVYTSIVGLVIFSVGVNPASAGWLLHKIRCHHEAKQAASCCEPVSHCEPMCEPVCEVVDPCAAPVEAVGCEVGCDPSMVEGEIIHDSGIYTEGCPIEMPMIESPMIEGHYDPLVEGVPMDSHEPSSSDIMVPEEPNVAPEPKEPAPAPKQETPQPVPPQPVPVDPAPVEPPAPMPAQPAGENPGDLFGDTPAEPAPAMPVEEPVPAQPADDLFGEPTTPAPTTPAPADAAPMNDLFGEPAAPADTAPADDVFGAPPATGDTTPAPAVDDIFGAPPADAAPAAEPAKDALDDLFGGAQVEGDRDPLANSPMRVWIDNTGDFSTEGRLVEIGTDFVRLLKSNGRTCTVPNNRLCPADVAYVASIVRSSDIKFAMASNGR